MTYDEATNEWLEDRGDPQQVTEVDLDENRDVSFLNSQDEEQDYDPPCCPPGAENKWRPETWCGCQR